MTALTNRFVETDPISELAINLFYGWGYNFYRLENQLRADDQLVREKACWLLGRARAVLEATESAYRREHLPPPSRANPFPDPMAVAGAQALERLSRAIGALEGQVRSQPVPENDRMTQRYRQEAATLKQLGLIDQTLIGQAELLRAMIDGTKGELVVERMGEFDQGVTAISATLMNRQAVLFAPA